VEDVTIFNRASDNKPSEITKKVYEALNAGARNIEIYTMFDGSGNRYAEASITPSQRFDLQARAFELLINHDVDVLVACNAPIDMTGLAAGQNFAYQMANFCYQATKEYNACMGVVPVQPPTAAAAVTGVPTLAEVRDHVNALVAFDTAALQGIDFSIFDGITDSGGDGVPDNYAFWATTDEAIPTGSPPADDANVRKDAKDNPIDIGAYISVISTWCRYRNEAGPLLYPSVGYYHGPGDGSYAAMITTLDPAVSTTNQLVGGAEPLRRLSAAQVNSLAGARFVTFWTNVVGQFVVASGMTGAYNISQYFRSDFVRLTTVRITHEGINVVRIAGNPYIGQPNNAPNRSALENSIDDGLSKMQKRGALEGYRFSLVSTPTMRVLGQIVVDLTLIPAFEIQEIRARVGLAAA
jgi:hypothetical protein